MTIWLVGAGETAGRYLDVLKHLGHHTVVVGRGAESAARFRNQHGVDVATGLDDFLATRPPVPDAAIVAVSADQLSCVAVTLANYGVPKILVEKPAGRTTAEIAAIKSASEATGAHTFVAYNRRFFASVQKARDIVRADGGLTSMTFEFTEWPSRVLAFSHPAGVLDAWFLVNSTHVVDLAFYFGGHPRQLYPMSSTPLPWHPYGAFVGAGMTDRGVPFAYHADWQSAGRWKLELCTRGRRLILAPLERLSQIATGSVEIEAIEIDDEADRLFKPGFLAQVKALLTPEPVDDRLLTIDDHLSVCAAYEAICPRGGTMAALRP